MSGNLRGKIFLFFYFLWINHYIYSSITAFDKRTIYITIIRNSVSWFRPWWLWLMAVKLWFYDVNSLFNRKISLGYFFRGHFLTPSIIHRLLKDRKVNIFFRLWSDWKSLGDPVQCSNSFVFLSFLGKLNIFNFLGGTIWPHWAKSWGILKSDAWETVIICCLVSAERILL